MSCNVIILVKKKLSKVDVFQNVLFFFCFKKSCNFKWYVIFYDFVYFKIKYLKI